MAMNTLRENEKRLGPKSDKDDKAPAAGQCLRASAADPIGFRMAMKAMMEAKPGTNQGLPG